ncbi:MAG: hypothetical protein Q7J82_04425 [Coriobacteriia bacterium]|nr:hypothetical protein [Coriobacteriia bacterium]
MADTRFKRTIGTILVFALFALAGCSSLTGGSDTAKDASTTLDRAFVGNS